MGMGRRIIVRIKYFYNTKVYLINHKCTFFLSFKKKTRYDVFLQAYIKRNNLYGSYQYSIY